MNKNKYFIVLSFLLVSVFASSGFAQQEECTDVFSCIENKNTEKLSTLITPSNINTPYDLTPLMFANKTKNFNAVKLLVTRGANLEVKGGLYKSTVLIQAAEQGNIDIMKYLVENKADIEAIDVDGGTAFDCAAYEGTIESLKYLMSVGANINHQGPVWGNTPLILASMNGHTDSVRYLLSINAERNLKNKEGKTACDVAKSLEIKKLLGSCS
jgi:ankyrin repeat protein